MVQKVSLGKTASGGPPVLYDISDGVGIAPAGFKAPPNNYDDVLLVQYFLRSIYRNASPQPLGSLAVDGILGPMTHYWCLFFMHHMEVTGDADIHEKGGNLIPYHRNQAKFATLTSSMVGALNYQFWKKHQTNFVSIEKDDAAMPATLRTVLKQAKSG